MNPLKSHNWEIVITDSNGGVWQSLFAQKVQQPERKINTAEHNEGGRMVKTPGMLEYTTGKITFLVAQEDDSDKLELWLQSASGRGASSNYEGSIRLICTALDGTTVVEETIWKRTYPINIKKSDKDKMQKAENSTVEVEFAINDFQVIV